jgi:PRTRC genetic system protein E
MFTELYAVAKHTPLQISVSPDGARLNVLIVPKPGDDANEGSALTRPIQAIGTPEELDRELPAKLAEYCAAINDLRLKIDLPIEAITAEAGKGGAKKKATPPAARKPARVSVPPPVKKAAPKPMKPVKKAAAVKPASPAAIADVARRDRRTEELAAGPSPALQARMEAAKDKPAVSPTSASSKPASASEKSKRATREECLADLRAWLTANAGKPITRAGFLASNTTARSYERKFKSWDEFLAEGKKAPDEWENKFPGPGDESQKSGDEALPAKATASRTVIDPSMKWPFPGSHEAAPAATRIDRVIYLRKDGAEDKMLGTASVPFRIGDYYNHLQLGDLRVQAVEEKEDGSERIIVVAPDVDPLPNNTSATKPRLKLTADGPAPTGDTVKTEV